MGRFEITPDLITGIDDIDGHHRALIEKANKIVDVSLDGNNVVLFQEALSFLNGYVLYHFAAEEHLMKRAVYPRLDQHRLWHEHFRSEIRGYMDRAVKSGIFKDLALKISFATERWLKEHIKVMDRDLAAFLQRTADPELLMLPDAGTLKESGELPPDFDTEVTVIYESGYEPGTTRSGRRPERTERTEKK